MAESLRLYRAIDNWLGVATCLESLGRSTALAHQTEQSAPLYGAATTLREAIDEPIQPSDRANYGRELAELRSMLDHDSFAAA